MTLSSIAVFCASSPGYDEKYMQEAYRLGAYLSEKHIRVIYGGARVGLMGAVADGALSAGGEVIGVLPVFLQDKEVAHQNLSELIWVESMHERKMKMHALSDGVICLPGGFGTLEVTFEMLTWGQLGLHQKPVGLLNMNGFFTSLLDFLDQMVVAGFLKQSNRDMLLEAGEAAALLQTMSDYQPVRVEKWISKGRT
ncbi:TIGR00730 family Rossman fold protein [Catalinimonas sp. 4WD22]|uniref:LOG family protein n=1 Tax=Catalinimonas locisalis TaxID=3133978 RepID=UPI003101AFDD